VFSPEEIWSFVRVAVSESDGAIFLTAAFTGLRRGELLALRWREIGFDASAIRVRASYAACQLSTPKSGKVRSVLMARDVAAALARLGQSKQFVARTTSYSQVRQGCRSTATRSAAAPGGRLRGPDCAGSGSTV
jgi:integrase